MATRVTTSPAAPAPAKSLAEQAYEAVRDLIITLEIRPGAPISADDLMSRLGLGRTPVHQALKRLESESLVAVFPRRGTFATDVNITDLALVTEVRLQLEGRAAHSAAQRRTGAELEELRELLRTFDSADVTDHGLMALDTEVHRTIYRCAHNKYLEATLEQYYNLQLRIWYLFLDRLPHVAEHIAGHRTLIEAIIEGAADRAQQIALEHVSGFEAEIRSVL
ncbi:GntR family transcriptional regulator [Streptomyces sp. SID14478]|uniref:GntR family transcriptional regulator n=1 Tax=Streptomyces sp. SID14478 TaxID=2706073 RepID=UPI0013D94B1A|nr:GntR family transcriptional regulator [Streptomyces sp. SID14478]NEB78318.1 GntR family transcriptional regulator [Streptomyces sp. SID14478]